MTSIVPSVDGVGSKDFVKRLIMVTGQVTIFQNEVMRMRKRGDIVKKCIELIIAKE